MSLIIDLHSHSTFSDGVLTPEELLTRAHERQVDVLALTDHDETGGLARAQASADEYGVQFVPGVEVSVTWAQRTVHIVGLNIDRDDRQLNEGLRQVRAGREQRAREMGRRLDVLGFPNAYEGAMRFVSNPALISRTHFARFLVDEGYCPHMQAVFDRYLGDGKPGDVPVQWADLDQAVKWITEAGGIAVIAHPGRYKYSPNQFDTLFGTFLELGGQGIEVITGSHRPDQFVHYAGVARRYGFLASVGSDFHGVRDGRRDLGELPPLPSDLTPVWHDWF